MMYFSCWHSLLYSNVDEENQVCQVNVVRTDDHDNDFQFSVYSSVQSLDRFDTDDWYCQYELIILFDRVNEDQSFDY